MSSTIDWFTGQVGPGAVAPGCVLTVLREDRVIVWLIGEVDLILAPDLEAIGRHARRAASRMTIDASRVTFCDSTVLTFVEAMTREMPVAIRRPTRVFTDILAFARLSSEVSIHPAESETW